MSDAVDLHELLVRESEQTAWKENVADVDDVVETLSAFANDLAYLGGGCVVCGAREDNDAHGFPRPVRVGLDAKRLKEVEGCPPPTLEADEVRVLCVLPAHP
jgi:ATP-dependent DNA helicase RecG